MDIVEIARDLGKKIQEDERFIAMHVASQQCDADEALQNMIGEFNLKRMAINNEAQKEDRSEDLLRQYNNELRTIYAEIMQNPNMAAYTAAKNELAAKGQLLPRDALVVQRQRAAYQILRLQRQLLLLWRQLPLSVGKRIRDGELAWLIIPR